MKGFITAIVLTVSLVLPAVYSFSARPVSVMDRVPEIGSFEFVEPKQNQPRDPYHSETRVNFVFNRQALVGYRITLNGKIRYRGKPAKGSISVNMYLTESKGKPYASTIKTYFSFHQFRNLTPENIWICSGEGGASVDGLRIPKSDESGAEYQQVRAGGGNIEIGKETELYRFSMRGNAGATADVTLSVEIQPSRYPKRPRTVN